MTGRLFGRQLQCLSLHTQASRKWKWPCFATRKLCEFSFGRGYPLPIRDPECVSVGHAGKQRGACSGARA